MNTEASAYIEGNTCPVPEAGCWLWTVKGDVGGYGRSMFCGLRMLAHRFSWTIYKGEIPEGIDVCHKCDTPLCVNPDHLFLGTHLQNMQDMKRKGRRKSNRGEEVHNSTLTETNVRAVLESPLPSSVIARKMNLSLQTVSRIRNRKGWAHVDATIPERYLDARTLSKGKIVCTERMASCMVDPV